MAGKPKSWKKVRDERRKENFVGRGEPIRMFVENLQSESPDYMVISITGEGGVGKSTLLARFASIAISSEYNAIAITCDDKQTSPVLAMGYIAQKLAEKGIAHKEFDERYKKYGELLQELESDPKVPRGGMNLLAMGITDLTIKSLRKTPGVGVFFEYADEKAAGQALAELMQYSISKWGNKDEVKLLREPEQVLTPLFLKLIEKAYNDHKIVIMFDVFERTSDSLSSWLLALFNFKYGEFDNRVIFIISGRESLEQHWTELAGLICHNSLEPFNLDELRLYLSNHEITDDKLVSQIYEDTNGLPVLVELLAAAKPQLGLPLPDVSKDAVERFLQWTPQEERRQAVLFAAVPRQFNKDIISTILGEDAVTLFNWLSTQSYIRTDNERGWFFHEKVRELMIRYLRHTEPKQLSNIHEKLAEYFQTQQTNLNLQIKEAYENDTWQKLEIEQIYHLAAPTPEMHLLDLTIAFVSALRWRWQFCEQVARICIQIGEVSQTAKVVSLGENLLSIYKAFQQNEHAEFVEKLNTLSKQKGLPSIARSVCYSRRARAKRLLGKYEEAIDDYKHAIELDQDYGLTYSGLGETYRLMGKFDEAIKNFDLAIAFDPTDDWGLVCRALTYRSLGKFDETLNDFNTAIEINPKYSWAIAQRGITFRLMKKYDEAIRDLRKAIELNPNNSWAEGQLGLFYESVKDLDQALEHYTRATKIDSGYAWAFARQGRMCLYKGNLLEALTRLDAALKITSSNVRNITYRGHIKTYLFKYEEALDDFNEAIKLDQNYDWAYENRGVVYDRLGIYDKALDDFDMALKINPNRYYSICRRVATYKKLGNLEAHKGDLNVVLNPKSQTEADSHDIAIALVILDRPKDAMPFIEKCLKDPLKQTYIEMEDILESVRETEDFKSIFKEVKDSRFTPL